MAYNKFRWFSKGTYRRKPLKSKAPLLLRIQNGNFMDTSLISDIGDKKVEAHQHAKLRRIASQKLMEKGLVEEFIRLKELRTQLTDEFENDLWDKCLEKQRGSGTTEDMYWWYKKQCKLSYTKSELQIKGIL